MTSINLDKLPKYAQNELLDLRRQVISLQQALKEQQCDTPSRVQWGRKWTPDAAHGYLDDETEIVFTISQQPDMHVRVRLVKGGIYINGDSSLAIECVSSNCFNVIERTRNTGRS